MKTNADKYLKEGVNVKELIQNLTNCINKTQKPTYEKIKNFFEQKAQLLTEDEKVILRNVDTKDFEKIGRDKTGHLYLWWEDNRYLFRGYNHLFHFIKERRRIWNFWIIEIKYTHLPSSRRSLRISIEIQTLYAYVDYLKGVDNYGNLYYRRLSW